VRIKSPPELADQTVEERLITFDWDKNFHSFQETTRRGAFRPLCWVKTQALIDVSNPSSLICITSTPIPLRNPITTLAHQHGNAASTSLIQFNPIQSNSIQFNPIHPNAGIGSTGLLRPQRDQKPIRTGHLPAAGHAPPAATQHQTSAPQIRRIPSAQPQPLHHHHHHHHSSNINNNNISHHNHHNHNQKTHSSDCSATCHLRLGSGRLVEPREGR